MVLQFLPLKKTVNAKMGVFVLEIVFMKLVWYLLTVTIVVLLSQLNVLIMSAFTLAVILTRLSFVQQFELQYAQRLL